MKKYCTSKEVAVVSCWGILKKQQVLAKFSIDQMGLPIEYHNAWSRKKAADLVWLN